MDNPETLTRFGTQDTGRSKKTHTTQHNTENKEDEIYEPTKKPGVYPCAREG